MTGRALTTALVAALLVPAPALAALPPDPWAGPWGSASEPEPFTITQTGETLATATPCPAGGPGAGNATGVKQDGKVTSPDGAISEWTYTGKPDCPGVGGTFTAEMSADAKTVTIKGVSQFGTPFSNTWTFLGERAPPPAPTLSDEQVVATLRADRRTGRQIGQSIAEQIAADAAKQRAERWKILQDTQTKIFEIQQDVTVTRARTQDRAFNKWDEFIRNLRLPRAAIAARAVVGKGRTVCREGRCSLTVKPTAYGRRLIKRGRPFAILVTVRSRIPGHGPSLTVRRAFRIKA
jgi:hypothetical protein